MEVKTDLKYELLEGVEKYCGRFIYETYQFIDKFYIAYDIFEKHHKSAMLNTQEAVVFVSTYAIFLTFVEVKNFRGEHLKTLYLSQDKHSFYPIFVFLTLFLDPFHDKNLQEAAAINQKLVGSDGGPTYGENHRLVAAENGDGKISYDFVTKDKIEAEHFLFLIKNTSTLTNTQIKILENIWNNSPNTGDLCRQIPLRVVEELTKVHRIYPGLIGAVSTIKLLYSLGDGRCLEYTIPVKNPGWYSKVKRLKLSWVDSFIFWEGSRSDLKLKDGFVFSEKFYSRNNIIEII